MKTHSVAAATALILFIVTLIASKEAEGHDLDYWASIFDGTPYIELGYLVDTAEAPMGGFGYFHNRRWDFNWSYIGTGKTDWGTLKPIRAISISRVITPGWFNNKFFISVGLARLDSKDLGLVGVYNARLQFGYWLGDYHKIFIDHYSSAGLNWKNTGITGFKINLELTF